MLFLLIELCQNQILIPWKHLAYQYLFTVFYAIATVCCQFASKGHIFPGKLDWICDERVGGSEGCIVESCLLWFVYFAVLQTGCFAVVLTIHHLKTKYCCKRSVAITYYSQYSTTELGSLITNKSKVANENWKKLNSEEEKDE